MSIPCIRSKQATILRCVEQGRHNASRKTAPKRRMMQKLGTCNFTRGWSFRQARLSSVNRLFAIPAIWSPLLPQNFRLHRKLRKMTFAFHIRWKAVTSIVNWLCSISIASTPTTSKLTCFMLPEVAGCRLQAKRPFQRMTVHHIGHWQSLLLILFDKHTVTVPVTVTVQHDHDHSHGHGHGRSIIYQAPSHLVQSSLGYVQILGQPSAHIHAQGHAPAGCVSAETISWHKIIRHYLNHVITKFRSQKCLKIVYHKNLEHISNILSSVAD